MAEDTAKAARGTVTTRDGKKTRRVMARDFNKLANEVKQLYDDRKARREDLEKHWDEIDRQVEMEAEAATTRADDGTDRSWMAAVEMPWQASSLDILPKDAMRLIFPPGDDWYQPHVILTDEWAEKIAQLPLLAGVEGDPGLGNVDQESADMIIKAVMEHYHSLYDFRKAWKALLTEAAKYGTYVGREMLVDIPVFTQDYRGPRGRAMPVPALIPTSIRNVYLDDTVQDALHEGKAIKPAHIRHWWQRLEDLKRAAKRGAKADENAGWMPAALNKLKPRDSGDRKDHVELLEMEGDLVIDRDDGLIYLPDHIVTVASGNEARVVRLRPIKTPFRSYITGVYDHDDINSPYGTCPLLKGRPLQVIGSELANRGTNSAALDAEPAIAYDSDDTQLDADGGPMIAPGSKFQADNPDSIREIRGGDVGAIFAAFNGMKQSYEETLHIQDPRRGSDVKSHTTAFANQLVQARSLLPTEDFALDVESGPIISHLYMTFELVKLALKQPTTVYVNALGVDGHFELTKEHVDVECTFTVEGSRGIQSREEKRANFMAYYRLQLETAALKAQIPGAKLPNFEELDAELAARFGITDAARFFLEPERQDAQRAGGEAEVTGDAEQLLAQIGGNEGG
tara:strand:+ start:150 stop:2027 length:1878 start_codon:yes stop_codon:yes gene_type:complete